MYLSVEVSMYPLQDGYKPKIKEFLDDINLTTGSTEKNTPDSIEIRSSNMSTRVFGEFDAVNNLLNNAMKKSMQKYGKIVFVCKFLQGDARELNGYS